MVGSLDMEALYPSIDQKEEPKIVANEILKSKVDPAAPIPFCSLEDILPLYIASWDDDMDQVDREKEKKECVSALKLSLTCCKLKYRQ